jgi:anti-sigma factor RsiW
VTGEDHELARLLEAPEAPPGCPSEWTLQRLVAEELKGEDRDSVAAHTVSCTHCRARVNALDREREAFLRAHPFDEVEAEIAERALFVPDDPEIRVGTPWWERWRAPLLVLAVGGMAAMVVAMIALPGSGGRGDASTAPGNRAKGITALNAALHRDGRVTEVTDETRVRAGDELQFAVDTGTHDHLVLVGVDGTGAVTVYLPADGGASLPLEPGAGRVLDRGFRLDDAPGPEVFVAFLTDEPIDARDAAGQVRRWTAAAGAAGVPELAPDTALGGAVEVMALEKEGTREQ